MEGAARSPENAFAVCVEALVADLSGGPASEDGLLKNRGGWNARFDGG